FAITPPLVVLVIATVLSWTATEILRSTSRLGASNSSSFIQRVTPAILFAVALCWSYAISEMGWNKPHTKAVRGPIPPQSTLLVIAGSVALIMSVLFIFAPTHRSWVPWVVAGCGGVFVLRLMSRRTQGGWRSLRLVRTLQEALAQGCMIPLTPALAFVICDTCVTSTHSTLNATWPNVAVVALIVLSTLYVIFDTVWGRHNNLGPLRLLACSYFA